MQLSDKYEIHGSDAMSNTDRKIFVRLTLRRFIAATPNMASMVIATLCFILGALTGPAVRRAISVDEAIARKLVPPFPMAWRMGSNLYMQTAAEYRACCLQIYKCAEQQLNAILSRRPSGLLRPAVVMDLDETVLDNSAFESFLYKYDLEYTEALWQVYEKDYYDEVSLVPGAKDFIAHAERKGVTVIYISNRSEANQPSTIKALERLGINTGNINERILLKRSSESSDKSARRAWVAERYDVLLTVGDNLRDFSEAFAVGRLQPNDGAAYSSAIARRYARVDSAAAHWGMDWVILPNPVYGEWEKLLGDQPQQKLRATKMKLTEK